MNDGMYLRICAIRKNNNGWEFSDCNGESLKAPDEKSIFTSSMNKRYRTCILENMTMRSCQVS